MDLAALERAPEAAAGRRLFFDLDLERHDGTRFVARGVLASGGKYIEEVLPRSRTMLFDLENDPGETDDLSGLYPRRLEALARAVGMHRVELEWGVQVAHDAGEASEGISNVVSGEMSPLLREQLEALGYL